MSKPGNPANAPAGLADWLPLLGSICQILASFGEEREEETPRKERPQERLAAGGKRR